MIENESHDLGLSMTLTDVLTHENVRNGTRLRDEHVVNTSALAGIVEEVCRDVAKLMESNARGTRGTYVRNKFLKSVMKQVMEGREPSVAQVRGVLNVLLGNANRARGHFWSSGYGQTYRKHGGNPDGFGGLGPGDCRICGKPLKPGVELQRGVGATCWRRVLTM